MSHTSFDRAPVLVIFSIASLKLVLAVPGTLDKDEIAFKYDQLGMKFYTG